MLAGNVAYVRACCCAGIYLCQLSRQKRNIPIGRMLLESSQQFGLFNEGFTKGWMVAIDSINDQIKKYPERLKNINPEDFGVAFSKLVDTFAHINSSSIYTQLTSLNSLVLKAETKKGNVYTEVFFDEATGWQIETIVNIFKNQQLDINNSGLLDDMILAIKQYFDNPEIDYLSYLNQTAEYALPGTAFATAEF